MFRRTGLSGLDLDHLFNLSPNPYVILDRDLVMVGMNDAYVAVTMQTREALVGRKMFDVFPSDPQSPHGRLLRQSFAKVLQSARVDHLPLIPYPIAKPDGSLEERFWSATHTPILAEDGRVRLILQHTVDVTELHMLRQAAPTTAWKIETDVMRRADAVQGENLALGQEREYLRSLFEQAPGFMAVLRGPQHVFEIANAAYLSLVGRGHLIGRPVREALPDVDGQGFFELLDQVYRSGEAYSAHGAQISLQRSHGSEMEDRFIDFIYQPLRDATGAVTGIFVQGHDVTELRRAQEAASESEDRFRMLAQSLPNHVWTATADGGMDWVNHAMRDYSGVPDEAEDLGRIRELIHPDDRPRIVEAWGNSVTHGEAFHAEMRLRCTEGNYRWFLSRAVPIRNARGDIVRWVGTNTDIEEQKKTVSRLENLATTLESRVEERTAELLRTQEVLRQSQKMEAIGNLAGGIAHDFNNLLQVITGNLQLLAKDIAGNEAAERRLGSALSGASRGARLASQLLSFGRRQPLAPKVLNLGRLVREMDHLIRRSLGEAIEIDTIVGGGLWNTQVDPSNVENALLNLAINARDAMEGRGRLTIELGNAYLDDRYAQNAFDVEPGQYVMLAVSDTGCGMPPEVLARAFDPFFTTKPEGKGTGLGLSMVYGFVKQSGGHINIYSELGSGTTVRIYLPRSMEAEDMLAEDSGGPVAGGSETILVVEDDEAVRDITVSLLSELGYKVLKARDADSGLAIIESGVPIDLLFTDVVMPGRLKSSELARKAKERRPDIEVLFTSGYTENSIVHGGRLDPGVNLLSKPYARETLARKIRMLLDRARERGASHEVAAVPTGQGSGPPPSIRVLLCEDEALIRISTADYLQDFGMTVVEAGSAREALDAVDGAAIDILVTDVHLPDMNGLDLLRRMRESHPDLPVIFATGDMHVPGSEGLTKATLVTKPYDYDVLARRIREMVGDIRR
ncbi:PAS domain-containing protein [Rhizobium sp. CSW-27]|uniref:hybrid sensor histidine kinase/response regulator n=1 Tax=Rhizobium sp. CSW-27 TaxID=2839985 RepID=UPI001C023BE6|nr:PAS domain-containing protein [Rhizobium sp. CSW-27]MBT9371084.1 PAS domain-containing protein [Rhizobium sp. CSW-27]